ncbi:MAG: hypothetical protein QOH93_1402 [Chloroflexia bacterium]|jgi:hypothetical protein|nr:hypothetical protein [Chloroflexia bacterium]
MADSYYRGQQDPGMSGQNQVTGPGGADLDANPGEQAMTAAGAATDASMSGISVGNKQIGVGAQVGIMRNLEFTAGGRAHRVSTGPYTKA